MKLRIILALAAFSALPSFADTGTPPLADTTDLARYATRSFSDGKLIDVVKNHPRFLLGGASYKGNLHLQPGTYQSKRGTVYKAAALLSDATGRLFYRKYDVTVGTERGPRQAVAVYSTGDVDLAQTHFKAYVGLIDRILLLEDDASQLTFSFPLGVGGIDEAVITPAYRGLTPKFKNATIDRAQVQPNRVEPVYYRGKPFMPITNSDGLRTSIAFHITILADQEAQQYGLNYLVRGFESHGCMRMREKDLMEFFTIVMNGGSDKIPVAVDNYIFNKDAQGARVLAAGNSTDVKHPHPLNNESFMRVTRYPEPPFHKRDDIDHLVIMDRAQGQPDFARLLTPVKKVFGSELLEDYDLMFNGGFEAP